MKLGVYTVIRHDKLLGEALAAIRDLGLHGAEINSGGFVPAATSSGPARTAAESRAPRAAAWADEPLRGRADVPLRGYLFYRRYGRPGRVGRGVRPDALFAAAHCGLVWLTDGVRSAGHRGVEWLKKGLFCSK